MDTFEIGFLLPTLLDQINIKYESLKSAGIDLGQPLGDIKQGAKQGGYREYQFGTIFCSSSTGAHEVHGKILEKYKLLGAENSFLGYPTSDEAGTPDNVGRFNYFEGGSIYWTPNTGAHEVHGYIYMKWADMTWEKSWLGYPTYDEYIVPGTNTRRSIFVGGAIDWTPQIPGKEAEAIKHFYDLKALDWGYSLSSSQKEITFFALVANVGTQVVTGPGKFAIGITINDNIHIGGNEDTINANFSVTPGTTAYLMPGLTVPFSPSNKYSWLEFWFSIAGDTCNPPNPRTSQTNNGRIFFMQQTEQTGVNVGDPKQPVNGRWIVMESGKSPLSWNYPY